MSLRGKTAIVGVAEFKPARYTTGETTLGMLARVGHQAIADAGLEPREVDGLVTENFNEAPFMAPSVVCEYMGLRTTFADVVDLGGATSAAMVWHAAAAIAAGMCETVVCVTAARREQRPASAKPGAPAYKDRTPQGEFDVPYGATGAVYAYAMVLNRYRERYSLTPEQLARVAVVARYNARYNPNAIHYGQPPLTIDEVLASPMLSEPIRRLEMPVSCAGAAALVLTSAERAARLPRQPVYLLGAGECNTHRSITWAPDIEELGARPAAEAAFRMAGLRPTEMSFACIYDCFTFTVPLELEDAGFAARGCGGKFVEEHDLQFDGDFPVNPGGGQLGCGHWGVPAGMSLITEAAFQLMGRCEAHQVRAPRFAFVNGNGGEMSSHVGLILGRER